MRNRKNYCKEYYREHRDKKLARRKQYHKEHRDEELVRGKQYYIKHRDEELAYGKLYYQKNRDKKRAYFKKYYEQNKDKNQDKYRAYSKQYYEQNKEKNKQSAKAWRENHRERWHELERRKNSKRQRKLGFVPLNEWFEGSEAHHICPTFVIYIPKELHRSIKHSVLKWQNMNRINKLAWEVVYQQRGEYGQQTQ